MASIASGWVIPREQDAAFESLFAAEYATVVAIALSSAAEMKMTNRRYEGIEAPPAATLCIYNA